MRGTVIRHAALRIAYRTQLSFSMNGSGPFQTRRQAWTAAEPEYTRADARAPATSHSWALEKREKTSVQ